MEYIQKDLVAFMGETTIHGIRYLAQASKVQPHIQVKSLLIKNFPFQFHFERCLWCIGFALIIHTMRSDIMNYLDDIKFNPIQTTVSLVPIDQVPFPAVIIDAGDPVDPYGYIKQSKDMVTMSDIRETNPDALEEVLDAIYYKAFKLLSADVARYLEDLGRESVQELRHMGFTFFNGAEVGTLNGRMQLLQEYFWDLNRRPLADTGQNFRQSWNVQYQSIISRDLLHIRSSCMNTLKRSGR